jgi:hypothetical protein
MNNANTITVSGTNLDKLRKLSGFVDSMANHYNVEDSLTFKREYLPSFSDSDWSLLRDLAESRTIGYADKNGILQSLNASKGYTPEQVSRVLDFLLVGERGKELQGLNNYVNRNQGTVPRGVGIHKPAAAAPGVNNNSYYPNANNNNYNYNNNNNANNFWERQRNENRMYTVPRGSTAKNKRNYRKTRKGRKASRRNGKK